MDGGEPKVDEPDPTSTGEDHTLWLDITVRQARGMTSG
jgi:hypothetical protein